MNVNPRLLQSLNNAHQADLRRHLDGARPAAAHRLAAPRPSRALVRRAQA